jgi:hypothetical protein
MPGNSGEHISAKFCGEGLEIFFSFPELARPSNVVWREGLSWSGWLVSSSGGWIVSDYAQSVISGLVIWSHDR